MAQQIDAEWPSRSAGGGIFDDAHSRREHARTRPGGSACALQRKEIRADHPRRGITQCGREIADGPRLRQRFARA